MRFGAVSALSAGGAVRAAAEGVLGGEDLAFAVRKGTGPGVTSPGGSLESVSGREAGGGLQAIWDAMGFNALTARVSASKVNWASLSWPRTE